MNTFIDLPESWQDEVRRLREDCARYRRQRNGARREADRLRAELAARRDG